MTVDSQKTWPANLFFEATPTQNEVGLVNGICTLVDAINKYMRPESGGQIRKGVAFRVLKMSMDDRKPAKVFAGFWGEFTHINDAPKCFAENAKNKADALLASLVVREDGVKSTYQIKGTVSGTKVYGGGITVWMPDGTIYVIAVSGFPPGLDEAVCLIAAKEYLDLDTSAVAEILAYSGDNESWYTRLVALMIQLNRWQ